MPVTKLDFLSAVEQASFKLYESGLASEKHKETLGTHILRIKDITQGHDTTKQEIESNPMLSTTGKRQEKADLCVNSNKRLGLFIESLQFTDTVEKLQVQTLNRLVQRRDSLRHRNETLRFMQESEARRNIYSTEESNRRLHNEMLKTSDMTSDQERQYPSIVPGILEESIRNLDEANAVVIDALIDAPSYMRLLTGEQKSHYTDMLSRTISPLEYEELDFYESYGPILQTVVDGALKSIDPDNKRRSVHVNPVLKPLNSDN